MQGSSSNSRGGRATSHSGSPDSDCMTEYSTTSEPNATAAAWHRQRLGAAGGSPRIRGEYCQLIAIFK